MHRICGLWGLDLKFDWSFAGKFSIHHFIPPSESSTFCQSKKKGQTAHFSAPLSFFHQKPEAVHLYLNFLCTTMMVGPKKMGTEKSKPVAAEHICIIKKKHTHTQPRPNPAIPSMFVTFITCKYLFAYLFLQVTHGDFCALNSVASDLLLNFVSHPLALSGIPGMRPGRAGRVFPPTLGPPRSPLTRTRSHRAATRRWTTETDPCQPSAPGEDRLHSRNKERQFKASHCEMSRLLPWQPCSKCSADSSKLSFYHPPPPPHPPHLSFPHGAAAMRHLFQFLLTTN